MKKELKIFDAFGPALVQDCLNIFRVATANGIRLDRLASVLEEYIAAAKIELIAQKKNGMTRQRKYTRPCPQCDHPMQLYQGDSNDCFWACRKCRYSEYRPHGIAEELKRIGVKE